MEYKNISTCLSGYWETLWAKLPDEQRQAWHEALGLAGGDADTDGRRWDARGVEERQYVVDWYDCGHDPAREGERQVAEYDLWLDASTHMQLKDVTPRNAAMLLCRINPLEEKDPENVYIDGDESSPKRFRLLLLAFEDEARTSPKNRTLAEWRTIAQQRGLRYHAWIDAYVKATSTCNATLLPDAPISGAPMLDYQIPMFQRLEPLTPWRIGRVADTDVLNLDDAASFASKQAGTEIRPADFLRAAARGEISLKAIVHHEAKLKKHDGGIYCNHGMPTENTTPKGSIPTLPLSACQHLANAGCASWRTYDGFESIDGELMRFTVAALEEGEPDFETVPTDCRVMGWDARALADAFMDMSATKDVEFPPTPATTRPLPAQKPESSPLVSDESVPRSCLFALPGVKTTEIIDAFNLVEKKWLDTLSRKKDKRYSSAIHTPGGRGKGMHTWKPADFAICLLNTSERKNPVALRAIITKHWPDWLPEFESQLEEIGKK